ncbi:MAG: YfhH family protein [Alicyclobacillus sp.]|nr:YfhH family protein [Alicyclobacillus sp.]
MDNQGQKVFDEQNWSEYHVLMTRWYLAKSYLIQDTVHIENGKTYRLTEADDTLTVTHRKGIVAWGIRGSDGQELAVPIAMLQDPEQAS